MNEEYLNYMENQPIRDGLEIRNFLEEDNEKENKDDVSHVGCNR